MTVSDILRRDLLFELNRCIELFNSQVFTTQSDFTQSAFIEILIRLDYILQKLSKEKNRIIWTDNIEINQNIKDITDLVSKLRNAACHSDSLLNNVENTRIKFVFNKFIGKWPNAIQVGKNIFLGNEYEDDIAFYYGNKRIYLVRHIKKLLDELPNEISKLK